MNKLLYLYFLKAKGFIRKLFSRVSSTILTVVVIALILGLCYVMSMIDIPEAEKAPFEILVVLYLGFSLFMMMTMMFQKRTAYIYPVDGNLLFVGPFKKKDVILFGLLGSLSGTLMFAVMTYGYTMLFFGQLFSHLMIDNITFLITGLLIFYNVFVFIDMLYICLMTSKYQSWIKRGVIALVILIIAAIFGYYYLMSPTRDLDGGFMSFVASNAFSAVPVIGWAKMSLIGFHYGDMVSGLMGLGFNLLLAVILTYVTLNHEDIDVEVMMEDASWAAELKTRAKNNGSNLYTNLKVHEVKGFKWGNKAKAIRSRMLLDMLKTRSFITKQEIAMIALYLVISIFDKFDFAGYSRYVMIILFMITMSSNYNDELKHHYIYLLPDKPIKKLIALLEPTFLKIMIVIMVMLGMGLFLRPTVYEFISALFEMIGYGILFVSANIWSLKVLKSSSSQTMNQLVKMLIIIVAAIPSILIGIFFNLVTNIEIFSFVCSIVNIVVACFFIYISKGIISNDAFIED